MGYSKINAKQLLNKYMMIFFMQTAWPQPMNNPLGYSLGDDVHLLESEILAPPIVSTFECSIDRVHGQQAMNSAILDEKL